MKEIVDKLTKLNKTNDISNTASVGSYEALPTLAGSKNQSALGKVVPLILGKTLFAPYILGNAYTTLSGVDGCDQTYHALFLIGYHNLKIENVAIGNEVLASNSNNVESGALTITSTKYPVSTHNTQLELQQGTSEVSLYNTKVVQENFNVELLTLDSEYGGETGVYAYAFSARYPRYVELEVSLNGLCYYGDDGSKNDGTLILKVEQSLDGGNTWQVCQSWDFSNSTDRGEYSSAGAYQFRNKTTKQLRYVQKLYYTKAQVDALKDYGYTVIYRISRVDSCAYINDNKYLDRSYFTAIRTWCCNREETEVVSGTTYYKYQVPMNAKERNKTARLGFSIKVSDDLVNYFDKINVIATSKARTWDEANHGWKQTLEPTDNPSALALYVMTGDFLDEKYRHSLYLKQGDTYMSSDKIDLQSFGDAYTYFQQTKDFGGNITDQRYKCDGAILSATKKIDLVNTILQTARSFIVMNGKKYGIFVDKPITTPLLNLNHNNLLSLMLTKNYDDISDGQRVKYVSAINYYQADTIDVYPYGSSVDPASAVLENIEMPYIADPYHAKAMSLYKQACKKLRPETLQAKVSTEGALAEVGCLITVQSPIISVGIGEGAEIVELIEESNEVIGIRVDAKFPVADTSKT